MLAETGYDSDRFIFVIENNHVIPMVLSKKTGIGLNDFFKKLKHYRWIATRHERWQYTIRLCLV